MTSKPASRRARATTLAPRSWPSRPGLAITIRIFASLIDSLSILPSRPHLASVGWSPHPVHARAPSGDGLNDGGFLVLTVHGPKDVTDFADCRLGFDALHHVVHGVLLPVGCSPQRIQRPTRLRSTAVGAVAAEPVDLFTLNLGVEAQDGDGGVLGRDELVNADDDLFLALQLLLVVVAGFGDLALRISHLDRTHHASQVVDSL